jgi:uncharacterized protein YcfL
MTFSLLAAAGCKSVNTVERAEPRAQPQYVDTAHFDTDPSLTDDLKLVSINEAALPDGTLKIQADVYNDTRSRQRFNYTFEWIDESGMLVRTPTQTWKPASLMGGETITLTAIAPSTRAVDFRLKLVEAKR